ncbi:hypothetical protein T265_05677 [Opisthorchis viverrini]|uniref:Uncharacterized protein n=1 Tax=Opisthorchis viverrini TaxID=6198 RepID=A0A075AF15_OPIVI|nr:hypothetical protein T265_05677 [Opisthorchis viverrini]KER27274.1 hypothetical protein T265_05677 [Opisthorchis viverrini]
MNKPLSTTLNESTSEKFVSEIKEGSSGSVRKFAPNHSEKNYVEFARTSGCRRSDMKALQRNAAEYGDEISRLPQSCQTLRNPNR